MATGSIGKRAVDGLKPEERDQYLWDDELPGFGVKVTPSGRKVYLVQYRLGGRKGRTRRVTIGQHGELWTPDKARRRARAVLGEAANSRDPAAELAAERRAHTVNEVILTFLAEHVATKCKASTRADYERILRQHVAPALGARRLPDVTRADIAKLHHGLARKPYRANAVVRVLSALMNWAELKGLRPLNSNPCTRFKKYPEQSRERFLSEAELAALGIALADAERMKTASVWVIGAIRLLLFTGARLREITTARREWLDEKRGVLRLPDSKTGAKTIYLNAPALQVVKALLRLEGNPFLICGDKPGAHLVNLEKPWRRIRSAATVEIWREDQDERLSSLVEALRSNLGRAPSLAECREAIGKSMPSDYQPPRGLLDVRLHDLRHAYASVGATGGLGLPILGALLGHSQPSVTARYAHLSADPLRAASEAIATRIEQALKAQDAPAQSPDQIEP